ncbi:hypothetical protein [uncultured Campylobacter sp.]|uniref:hypothetical protein n=1 Tax=uncultured Campylobacter sp. TaxID=218934 RepID=UPI002610B08F|nr:hypothetical protein [uncultured Campylobacter sp.]
MKKIIFFALLLAGAAWTAKFDEPDADKNKTHWDFRRDRSDACGIYIRNTLFDL